MSHVKLNDYHRTSIRQKLLDAKFLKPKGDLEQRKCTLAHRVYNEAFPADVREKMAAIPEGWLPRVTTIRARLGGVDFGYEIPKHEALPVPYSKLASSGWTHFLLAADWNTPLAQECERIRSDEKLLKDQEDSLRREISALIWSVHTNNRLIAVWPEIRSVVDEVCRATATADLPAPIISHLNQALGLKPAK